LYRCTLVAIYFTEVASFIVIVILMAYFCIVNHFKTKFIRMSKSLLTIISIIGFTISSLSAQTTEEYKPSGKVEALIFTNFNSSTTNNKSLSKFEVTRAYFGYNYGFSKVFSGRVGLDFVYSGVGSLSYTAYLKFGYMQYQKNNFTLKFGLIGTNIFNEQEKLWGNRYVFKSFQDQYGMGSSADFGLSAAYQFCDAINADVIIQNGEGYKSLEADSALRVGAGVTVHPVKSLTLRVYYDNMSKNSVAQQTTAFAIGYSNKSFNLNAEYNTQVNNKYKSGNRLSGYSIYGTLFFNSKTSVLARHDFLTSKDNSTNLHSWNYSKDGQQYLVGIQFALLKGLRISPNYQLWIPKDGSKSNTSAVFLNLEIRI
jgi:hypothetical protein